MEFKDLIKTSEGAVVLGGLVLTVLSGKFWAIATGITYVILNVPNLVTKIKEVYSNIKK